MVKRTLSLIALALFTAGALLWWNDDSSEGMVLHPHGTKDRSSGEDARRSVQFGDDLESPPEAPLESPGPVGAEPDHAQRELLVVDELGEPVAGAAVDLYRVLHKQPYAGDELVSIDKKALSIGLRTDAAGRVLLSRKPGESVSCLARHPRGWGTARIHFVKKDQHRKPAMLRIEAGRALQVLVRDAENRAISHAQLVLNDPDSNELPPTMLGSQAQMELHTFQLNDEGRTTLFLKGDLLKAKRLKLRMIRFGETPPFLVVDVEQLGSDAIEFVVPETLTVTFRLPENPTKGSREGWGLVCGEADVTDLASSWGTPYPGTTREMVMDSLLRIWRVKTQSGGARFTGFAPGAEIKTTLRGARIRSQTSVHRLPDVGPAEIVLTAGEAKARLRVEFADPLGRVLHPDHFAIRRTKGTWDQAVKLELSEDGTSASLLVESGEPGEMAVYLGPVKHSLRARRPARLLTTLAWPELAPQQVYDLGRVEAPALELIAAGRVVDSGGEPVKDASLSVSDVGDLGNLVGGRAWGRSDGDGRFEVRGFPRSADQELRFRASGFVSGSVEFLAGTRDLRIEMLGSAEVTGRVRAASPEISGLIEVVLSSPAIRRPRTARPEAAGRFRIGRLNPGVYCLEVKVKHFVALRLEGIEVEEGETIVPEELEDCVVGDDLAMGLIRVLGPDGEPMSGVLVAHDPAQGWHSGSTNARGELRWLHRRTDPQAIRIQYRFSMIDDVRELRPMLIEAPRFPLELQVSYEPMLQLKFDEFPELAESGAFLVLGYQRSADELRLEQARLDAAHRAMVQHQEQARREGRTAIELPDSPRRAASFDIQQSLRAATLWKSNPRILGPRRYEIRLRAHDSNELSETLASFVVPEMKPNEIRELRVQWNEDAVDLLRKSRIPKEE